MVEMTVVMPGQYSRFKKVSSIEKVLREEGRSDGVETEESLISL